LRLVKSEENMHFIVEKDNVSNASEEKESPTIIRKIPKTLMQTYKTRCLPNGMAQAVVSWHEQNPNYKYEFFTDEDAEEYITNMFGEKSNELKAFRWLIPGAYKSDVFRLCYLYRSGGIYADISMVSKSNIDNIIGFCGEDTEVIMVRECELALRSRYSIYNAFMAAAPGSNIIKSILNGVCHRVLNSYVPQEDMPFLTRILQITGPTAVGEELNIHCGRDPRSPFRVGKDLTHNYYLLRFVNGKVQKVSLPSDGNSSTNQDASVLSLKHQQNQKRIAPDRSQDMEVIQTKYQGWMSERPRGSHYSTLFREGRIYKQDVREEFNRSFETKRNSSSSSSSKVFPTLVFAANYSERAQEWASIAGKTLRDKTSRLYFASSRNILRQLSEKLRSKIGLVLVPPDNSSKLELVTIHTSGTKLAKLLENERVPLHEIVDLLLID
jgi:hypothetical protein